MFRQRHSLLRSLASLFLVSFAAVLSDTSRIYSAEKDSVPNIVFILADDLGWTDLGCMGSKYYETPNIDRLAAAGMKFTNAYTCGPNCAPTRACLISGKYTPRHGIYTVSTGARGQEQARKLVPAPNKTELPLEEITVAQALKQAGYATAMFGKWHLGNGPAHHPGKRGFDEAIVSAGRHFNFTTVPKTRVNQDAYLADFLTERAVDFIERHKEKPFFLYLPHFAVHTPLEAKKDRIAKYQKKESVGGHGNPTYAAMIDSLDESVGRILDKLDQLKLTDNTVVFFSSDNGGVGGYGGIGSKNITDNAPLRGGKGMLYEGGFRVPLLVRWPGVVKPKSTCATNVCTVDFYPTLLAIAGAKGDAKQVLDGVSLVPLLRGEEIKPRPIFWHFPGYLEADVKKGTWRTTPAGAVRVGPWKLIEFFEDGRLELYNTANDIGEKTNLADQLPERVKEMHQRMLDWRKQTGAPMPQKK